MIASLILGIFFFIPNSNVHAETEKVLVIYTTKDGELKEDQRALDMLIGHFTEDITWISSEEVTKEDLRDVTHLFYYGLAPMKLQHRFEKIFDEFAGSFTAIGYNVEQLGDHFSFIDAKHERGINELLLTNEPERVLKDISIEIIDIEVTGLASLLIEGRTDGDSDTYPVMVQGSGDHLDHYYYAVDTILSSEVLLFGEVLHQIFGVDHHGAHPGYIRLEDIHPLVNPKNVEDIAKVLKEKNIPYMVAVIPVYTDPKTGKEFHFSDSPKLLKLLKKMQKDGASIILHGYTHQFRSSETGEGFEFWDVENNSPIYAGAKEQFRLKSESEFDSKKSYEAYIKELKEFETDYIESKLTKGIEELVNYGLYPLAFEAPHYTMSQNGYQVVSQYFSTYSGQLQLSDESWYVMDSTPYITSPTFLNGMELLPETIGYVKPKDAKGIDKVIENAERMSLTSDGVIAGFYHPYLGVEGFNELIERMEQLPAIEWINLKDRNVWVKSEDVHIYTEDGAIIVDANKGQLAFSSLDFFSYHYFSWSNYFAWGLCIVGGIAVIAFIMLTLVNSGRRKTA